MVTHSVLRLQSTMKESTGEHKLVLAANRGRDGRNLSVQCGNHIALNFFFLSDRTFAEGLTTVKNGSGLQYKPRPIDVMLSHFFYLPLLYKVRFI